MEIELIDDNTIKMLEIGSHITYMPKDKGTLYVGYTKYPQVPKTQEGYLRQGRDTEDGFIRFKQGLLQPSQAQATKAKKSLPPEVLYVAVEEKYLESVMQRKMLASDGKMLQLHKTMTDTLASWEADKEHLHVIKVDALGMYNNGIDFGKDKAGEWFTKVIERQYMTLIV